jgi:hypothetical protein
MSHLIFRMAVLVASLAAACHADGPAPRALAETDDAKDRTAVLNELQAEAAAVKSQHAEHAGESPEVATAVRQWLAEPNDLIDFDIRALRVALLRADPIRELEPAVQRIDQLIAEQKHKGERFETGGDVHSLVGAMAEIGSPTADRTVSRYVREPAINAGVRCLLVESLVRHHYENSPDLIAHWIREEDEPWPEQLRKAARQWDEFGHEALAKAEQSDFKPND